MTVAAVGCSTLSNMPMTMSEAAVANAPRVRYSSRNPMPTPAV
jgi:hypothetical protein